jgi:hypothetical protein
MILVQRALASNADLSVGHDSYQSAAACMSCIAVAAAIALNRVDGGA